MVRLGLESVRNCIRKKQIEKVERCKDDSVVMKCRDQLLRSNKERVDLERLGTKSWIIIYDL